MKERFVKESEIKILQTQNITTFLFILTLFVSIYLTYNEIKRLKGEDTTTSLKFDEVANLLNRIVGVLILIAILYLSFKEFNLAKIKNTDTGILKKEIIASILQLIAGIIILFVVIESQRENQEIGALENPVT